MPPEGRNKTMKTPLTPPPAGLASPTCSALDIADIQQYLIDEHARMMWALKDLPTGGTGSLTNRQKMRGAIDFGVTLSNWISRRQIEDGDGAEPCDECGGCFMVPDDSPNGDVMNTPCPKCNPQRPAAIPADLFRVEYRGRGEKRWRLWKDKMTRMDAGDLAARIETVETRIVPEPNSFIERTVG